MIGALTNHLWQSTLFVLAAALVALALRKNGAHIRHVVWVVASLKFLVPFSLFVGLGGALASMVPAPATIESPSAPHLSVVVDRITQPFTSDVFAPSEAATPRSAATTNWTPVLIGAWACGFFVVARMRLRDWRRIRAAVRMSTRVDLAAPVPVGSSPALLEPGVVGLFRPVLLLPAGIEGHLTPPQLEAVLAHELCHVRRRDNLTSAIHMVVEAIFWFHPLVWWVGAQLIEERERACDEHVLRVCGEPRIYAESILNVCKLYAESPLACVSGVGGSDLRKRVAAILVNRVGLQLSLARKVTLAIAAILAIALPLAAGMLIAPLRASAFAATQNAVATAGRAAQKFDVASVKPCETNAPGTGGRAGAAGASPGYLNLSCVTLRALVNLAYADDLVNKPYGPGGTPGVPELVRGGPSWAYSEKFTIEAKAEGVTDRATLTKPMLRSLLEDRFQLRTHRATEEQTMYALTVAKSGLKIRPIAPGECWEFHPGQPVPPHDRNVPPCGFGGNGWGSYEARGVKLGVSAPPEGRRFVDELFIMMRRMVIDRTGLDGRYSFALEFTPDDATPGQNGRCRGDARCLATLAASGVSDARPATFRSGDTIFNALEKLGLKLEQIKAPAEYIVIDHAERPRPNTPIEDAMPPARAKGAGK